MPDPERMTRLLRKAAAMFQGTPGRTGHEVTLVGAADVLVAGDLHGHLGHLQEILRIADLARQPHRHLVLQEVIHGPFQYPDGSDKSHQLLDLVAALKCEYPERVHFLPGNHEFAQFTGRPIGRSGGELNSMFRAGVTAAYGPRSDEVYSAYRELVFASPLALRTANRVFLSHTLPPAAKLAGWNRTVLTADAPAESEYHPGGSVYEVLWGRDLSAEAARGYLAAVDADLLITGHVPCDQGSHAPNDLQLVLDSQEPPAAVCLFPADRRISHDELLAGVRIL